MIMRRFGLSRCLVSEADILDGIEFARSSPDPDPADMLADVYTA